MAMPGQYSNQQGAYEPVNQAGSPGGHQGQPQYGNYPPGGSQGGYGYPPQAGNYPAGASNYPPGGYPTSYETNDPSATMNTSLKQMHTTTSMNLVFFGAACCVMLGSLISAFALFSGGQMVDFLETSYLFLFGGVLAILDTPFFKTIKAMGDLKMYIGKYINLLTRVTGKGLTFVFVGSVLFSTMWDNLESSFLLFLAVVLCVVPAAVGFAAIVIGVMKSQKLSKARKHIEQGALEQRYDYYAQTYRGPQGGLTPAEFNSLTMENGGFKWEDADLKLIFNALVSNPAWRINASAQSGAGNRMTSDEPKIPKEDLMSWVKGGMVWL